MQPILYRPTRSLAEAYAEWKRHGQQRGARIVRTPAGSYLVAESARALALQQNGGWQIVWPDREARTVTTS